jgi:hypothetical protein
MGRMIMEIMGIVIWSHEGGGKEELFVGLIGVVLCYLLQIYDSLLEE